MKAVANPDSNGPFTGSIYYTTLKYPFSEGIRNRRDVDANGFYDLIAHGTTKTILIEHMSKPGKFETYKPHRRKKK